MVKRLSQLPNGSFTSSSPLDLLDTYTALERTGGGTTRISLSALGVPVTPEMYGAIADDTATATRTLNVNAFNAIGSDFGAHVYINATYYTNNIIRITDSRVHFEFGPRGKIIANHTTGPVIWVAQELGKSGTGGALFSHISGPGVIDSDGARLSASPGGTVPASDPDGSNAGVRVGRDYAAPEDVSVNPGKYRSGSSPNDSADTNTWRARSFAHHIVEDITIQNQPGNLLWVEGVEHGTFRQLYLFQGGAYGMRVDGNLSYIGTGGNLGKTSSNGIINLFENIVIDQTEWGSIYHDNSNVATYRNISCSNWAVSVGSFGGAPQNDPGITTISSRTNHWENIVIQIGPASATGDGEYAMFITDQGGYGEIRQENCTFSGFFINDVLKGIKCEGGDDLLFQKIAFGTDRLTEKINIQTAAKVTIKDLPDHDGTVYIIVEPSTDDYRHERGGQKFKGEA